MEVKRIKNLYCGNIADNNER